MYPSLTVMMRVGTETPGTPPDRSIGALQTAQPRGAIGPAVAYGRLRFPRPPVGGEEGGVVSARFEELAFRSTPRGEISLRRRREPSSGVDVYEIKLDDEFLMSSLFTVAEVELARLGLAAAEGDRLDVVVGGLGLGCTARAALEDPRVASLHVVDALEDVIGWHEAGLLPLSAALTQDERCSFVHGDFFALVGEPSERALLPDRWHVALVDIDHTPHHVLHPDHAAFYEPAGLRRLADRLHPGGVFALWSDDPPDEPFLDLLRQVFPVAAAHVVPFGNPYTGTPSANTVYVATVAH